MELIQYYFPCGNAAGGNLFATILIGNSIITDGGCDISEEFLKKFEDFKANTGSKLTGILLDRGESIEFTLSQFADCSYRTSELVNDKIIENLIEERI